jgi:hypothetical protein
MRSSLYAFVTICAGMLLALACMAAGCATRRSSPAQEALNDQPVPPPYPEPAAIDGVPYKDPGPVQKIRNAFNTYR